jgi:hypothetical protein
MTLFRLLFRNREEKTMSRTFIPMLTAALALAASLPARAQSPGTVVYSRLAVPVQGQITAGSDPVQLSGFVRVDAALQQPVDPCLGQALVLISGVVPGQGASGQLYQAGVLRLAYLQGVCLDGVALQAIPISFLVNAVPPNPTVPPNPVVPPNPIRVAATAYLAFNANGTLAADHAAISVGSVDAPPTVDQ